MAVADSSASPEMVHACGGEGKQEQCRERRAKDSCERVIKSNKGHFSENPLN